MNKKHIVERYCQGCGKPFIQTVHGGMFIGFKCRYCKRTRYSDSAKKLTPDQYADSVLKSIPKDKDIY